MDKNIIIYQGQYIDDFKKIEDWLLNLNDNQKKKFKKLKELTDKESYLLFSKSKNELYYLNSYIHSFNKNKGQFLQEIVKNNIACINSLNLENYKISSENTEQINNYYNFLTLAKITLNGFKIKPYNIIPKKIKHFSTIEIEIDEDLISNNLYKLYRKFKNDCLNLNYLFKSSNKKIFIECSFDNKIKIDEDLIKLFQNLGVLSKINLENLRYDFKISYKNNIDLLEVTNNEKSPLSLNKIFSTIYYSVIQNIINPDKKIKVRIIHRQGVKETDLDKINLIKANYLKITKTPLELINFDDFYLELCYKYSKIKHTNKLNNFNNIMIIELDAKGEYKKYIDVDGTKNHKFYYNNKYPIEKINIVCNFNYKQKFKSCDNINKHKKETEINTHSKILLKNG